MRSARVCLEPAFNVGKPHAIKVKSSDGRSKLEDDEKKFFTSQLFLYLIVKNTLTRGFWSAVWFKALPDKMFLENPAEPRLRFHVKRREKSLFARLLISLNLKIFGARWCFANGSVKLNLRRVPDTALLCVRSLDELPASHIQPAFPLKLLKDS